jgi:hypothetical protein
MNDVESGEEAMSSEILDGHEQSRATERINISNIEHKRKNIESPSQEGGQGKRGRWQPIEVAAVFDHPMG